MSNTNNTKILNNLSTKLYASDSELVLNFVVYVRNWLFRHSPFFTEVRWYLLSRLVQTVVCQIPQLIL